MRNLKILSLLTTAVLLLSLLAVPAQSAANDVETLINSALDAHRNFASAEQEAAIKSVEADNNVVIAKGYNELPWSTILTGGQGLLTNEIKTKQSSVRTLTLEYLRGKAITLSTANAEIESKIAGFKTQNDAITTKYNLDSVSITESAAKYTQLEAELTSIYTLFNDILSDVSDASNTLLVDNTAFTALSDSQLDAMFSEKIANIFKDINSLMFAGKDTWQAAYNALLSGENKITMGLILGSGGAAALANATAMQQVYDYLDGTDVLSTVAQYQVDLYSDDFTKSNTALYSMISDVLNDILNLSGMADVKSALTAAGWSTDKIVSAMKVAQDAADVNFYSRAINLNMILGKYLGVYKDGVLQAPVQVVPETASSDQYDICVAKGNYKASVINVLDTAVYNPDNTLSSVTSSDDAGKLTFTADSDDLGTGYSLKCYRGGADKSKIWNYIASKTLDVAAGAVRVQSVTIKQGLNLEVFLGESVQLEAIISPTDATNTSVTWTSSNTDIVTVNYNGRVSTKALGSAVVTVTTADGGYTAKVNITVKKRVGSVGSMGSTSVPTPTPTVSPIPTTTPAPSGSADFVDLVGHWAAADLDQLIKDGIVSGYGNAYFNPDAPITRAEFAVIMCKMMELPITKEGVVYSDTAEHWSKDYVATATKYGYMIGVAPDMFAPDMPIPREQVIAVILRAIAFGHDILHAGTEMTSDAESILNLVKEHFGYEYTDLSQQLTDINDGSQWAKPYVEIAIKGGYVKGYEDNTVRPLINSTRAEAVVMAKRAILD